MTQQNLEQHISQSHNIKMVIGAGPVGWTIAQQLADAGHSVRLLTRSGSGPEHALIQRIRADASNRDALRQHMVGVDAVFHCAHGSKYDAKVWAQELPHTEQAVLEAAGQVGAVVVFPESLYSYSHPENVMTENSARDATNGKRGVRVTLLAARAESKTNTVSVVASDFIGPRVRMAFAGERMVAPILKGKRLWPTGSLDAPHTFTYMPDFAAAMIKAAALPETWNTVIHAPSNPALTQRQLINAYVTEAGAKPAKVTRIPAVLIRLMARFVPSMRELAETVYQFEAPFIMDSARSQKILGLAPTPMTDVVASTISWWRSEQVAP